MDKKISELILEGIPKIEQGYGHLFNFSPKDKPEYACALGTAILAAKIHVEIAKPETLVIFEFVMHMGWSMMSIPRLMYPIETINWKLDDVSQPIPITVITMMLNDDARWTREQIAEWLAGQGF